MKKIIILALLASTSPAFAQGTSPPSMEEMQAQYLLETGQLRTALGQAQAQLIQLRKENAELKAKGEKPPEPKK